MNEHKWYEHKRFDPAGREHWQALVAENHPDVNAAYPPGFWIDYARFCAGDTSRLGVAVAFLESDRWVFGSGSVKENFIHAIKHIELPSAYVERLQNVVLSVVHRRSRYEFRAYCRLARKVDAPYLREQLTRRLTHDDPDTRRRARWVLEALAQKDKTEKRA